MKNDFKKIDWVWVGCLFLLAAFIRFIPEIKGSYWPVGYDTFNSYIPEIINFKGDFLRWLFSANLLYFLLWPFYALFQIDPNILLKFAASFLYGLLASSFYIFCRKFLKWGVWESLFAGSLLIFQVPALRISWDLLRNALGLVFFFLALHYLQTNSKKWLRLGILGILISLSHQLVAISWFVIIAVWAVRKIYVKLGREALITILTLIPSVVIFYITTNYSGFNDLNGHVFNMSDSSRVFTYFSHYTQNTGYIAHISTVFALFWLSFKLILPFVIHGFWLLRRNIILTTLTAWLIFGTFSSVIFGGYGLFVWDRWMILLVFPFVIYAVASLAWIGGKIMEYKGLGKTIVFAGLFKTLGLFFGLGFLTIFFLYAWPFLKTPYQETKPPFKSEKINSYFPSTMVHNTIGYDSINNVLDCIEYLNLKAPEGSVFIVDNRYRGIIMSRIDLENRFLYSYSWTDEIDQENINKIKGKTTGPIYTIWNSQENIKGFQRVYYSGLVAVYRDKETYNSFKEKLDNN